MGKFALNAATVFVSLGVVFYWFGSPERGDAYGALLNRASSSFHKDDATASSCIRRAGKRAIEVRTGVDCEPQVTQPRQNVIGLNAGSQEGRVGLTGYDL